MFTHSYHRLFHKYIAAFGSLFNNITLVRYKQDHVSEIERIKVPIIYAPKEKYIQRLNTEPEGSRKTNVTFPAIGYELVGIDYNEQAQMNRLTRRDSARSDTDADSVYSGVPYTLQFELTIGARNQDDAYQILEQILPIFQPSFTVTVTPIPALGFREDVPITLTSVVPLIDWEGEFDSIRTVQMTLSFSMDVRIYGPVSIKKIIRTVFANVFFDTSLSLGSTVRMNLANGNNGMFTVEDFVYQGDSLEECTAAGVVVKYDSTNQYIRVGGVQGSFRQNTPLYAESTNAIYNVVSFDMTPLKIMSIKVEPDPITANANSHYGYTTTVLEYPDTV